MSRHTKNVTRTHKRGQKSCRWQLIYMYGSKHKYQWGMCYRCVELLPLLRVIPTHTPSLLMLRHSSVVHSCVVHPCFFVPPCPLPRCQLSRFQRPRPYSQPGISICVDIPNFVCIIMTLSHYQDGRCQPCWIYCAVVMDHP